MPQGERSDRGKEGEKNNGKPIESVATGWVSWSLGLGVPWSTPAPEWPQGWGCLGVLGLFWLFLGAPQGAWTSYRSRPAQVAPSACRTKIYLPQKWSLTLPSCPWPSPPLSRKSLDSPGRATAPTRAPPDACCTVLFVTTASCCLFTVLYRPRLRTLRPGLGVIRSEASHCLHIVVAFAPCSSSSHLDIRFLSLPLFCLTLARL